MISTPENMRYNVRVVKISVSLKTNNLFLQIALLSLAVTQLSCSPLFDDLSNALNLVTSLAPEITRMAPSIENFAPDLLQVISTGGGAATGQ